MEPEAPKKMSKVVLPLVVLLVVASLAASYYFLQPVSKSQKLLKDPTAAQTAEVKAVTAEVSKIMELPTGEDPSIATVWIKPS